MNPTETFPHRCIGQADDAHAVNWFCRCGKLPAEYTREVALGTWGSGCPVALREALANERALRERFEAEAKGQRADAAMLCVERDAALDRVTELEATLANERGDGEPPVEGWLSVRVYGGDGEFRPGWRRGDVVVVRFDQEKPWRVYDVDGTMFSPVLDGDGSPVEATTARAAIIAASAAGGAK